MDTNPTWQLKLFGLECDCVAATKKNGVTLCHEANFIHSTMPQAQVTSPSQVPFDVLDYIFGFLRSHPESLIACSKAHPVFSRAIERHLYYRVSFLTGWSTPSFDLIKILKETPRIINYIRVLEFEFIGLNLSQRIADEISLILPIFSESRLECIILKPRYTTSWTHLPESLKTALENCLLLPTLQRIHVGKMNYFPLSLLDNHMNINCLSLSGTPEIASSDHTYPQLAALSFCNIHDHQLMSFISWAKRHIVNLQSLKCNYSNEGVVSELLGIFSHTLNRLDLQLEEPYATIIYDSMGDARDTLTPSIDLCSVPHLNHLTIRGNVHDTGSNPYYPKYRLVSHLPAVVAIFKNAPLLLHLTICIRIDVDREILSDANFPFFTALAESAASFRHIDLYLQGISDTGIVSLFGKYGGVTALIEQGVLVIHMDKTAPADSRFGK